MGMQLVGVSRALREIDEDISLVAPLDTKVLITGEAGVGKDLVARLLHQRSQRTGPFVTINCAAVSDLDLDTCGWFGHAQGGTIFLDDVGELPLHVQTLLLRFLETGEIQPVGSDCVHRAGNVRVIAATAHNLLERVATGQFREDLYYRINVIHLVIPPLRERPEDVAPIAASFLDSLSAAHNVPRPVLTEEVLAKLTTYWWPGNVGELEKVLRRLVLRRRVAPVLPVDLPIAIPCELVSPVSVSRTKARRSMGYDRYEPLGGGDESQWIVLERLSAHARRRRHH
jgi:transcriptional regulator with PAS, ATPase and Fis domain